MTPWALFLNHLHQQQSQGTQSILLSLPPREQSEYSQAKQQTTIDQLYQHLLSELYRGTHLNPAAANDTMALLPGDDEELFLQELKKRQWQRPQTLASQFYFILGPQAPSTLLQQRLLKALEEMHSPMYFLWLGQPPLQLLPTVRSRTLIWRLSASCLAHFTPKGPQGAVPRLANHGQAGITTDSMGPLAPDLEKRQQLMATSYTKWPELIKSWNGTEKDLLLLFFDASRERFRSYQAWEKWQEFQQWYQQSLEWNNGSKERHFFLQQIFHHSP